jgi:hypothetical protein
MLNKKFLSFVVLLAIATYGGYYYGFQNSNSSDTKKTLELTTVAIKKGDLETKEDYSGTLRKTDKSILKSTISGVVTYFPDEGSVITFGGVLYSVDNKPVILLQGSTPFYRTLDLTSDSGPDILQLEEALVYLGYASNEFIPDSSFDEVTSSMLNSLYKDYGIETKSEITAEEQVAINTKKDAVKTIEETISAGGTSLLEVNDKKKKLEDTIESATDENAAWQSATKLIDDYYNQITILKDLTNPRTMQMTEEARKDEIKSYEDKIEEQKRLRELEEGKGSVIDASEALAIDIAQKAYDDALKEYNEGIDKSAELEQAKKELNDLELTAKSETFSPTNAYASETAIIVGAHISDKGSITSSNAQLYNISTTGLEVVFSIDAADQDIVNIGDFVDVELPNGETIVTTISFIDQVVTQSQSGDFVEVILSISNPDELNIFDEAPVDVFITTEVSKDILYVPVNALLALAEGGYALEIYDGSSGDDLSNIKSGQDTTYVGVEIGVFTDGYVEVKGNISEGQLVIVPR